ncbi:membrane protein [Clostridium acetobutylicum EA 2018]|uniref:Predicted membrane protein n=1 Tax=Clostridium acetobutylicum (strain ATCC 824 / DSM 792 / JCM 1419 / IAM 19013 / LMG 5710 / NBRC 13948 / NRRL B-527 / VKM B-1787 / 2291 / W) TaxID=272562 RepID=Q97IW2_CLOAB|nr:Predicted membrane protein [Clostridium acetobutylicum ATCC 824]ADZ20580.1 membrane protein [Clostridium acetobutylicum EA 2018]AEI31855.1 hypothetical protein SMB_G1553 [Clostridium acetobutylicum DSM 1731]AWV81260.1 hypothetical protein DK921_14405 [Clostridium acetobutylicum]PSM04543.1 hypothetical protein C7T89_14400 [Clostridium sp. NJ4]
MHSLITCILFLFTLWFYLLIYTYKFYYDNVHSSDSINTYKDILLLLYALLLTFIFCNILNFILLLIKYFYVLK